tara:strand:- start:2291 stop:2617 length:327 start_codon:yes stop_codon:yes gene_type:complete
MTKDQYLRMVEQTGEEIDWERCPPDLEDFPDSIHTALNVYNSLGNKIFPDVGFVGKDFTLYDYLLKEYNIESQQEKDWIFQLLLHMESNDIAESQRKIKSEYDKIKKK